MTDREATIRLNVTGNAAQQLEKVAKAADKVEQEAKGGAAGLRTLAGQEAAAAHGAQGLAEAAKKEGDALKAAAASAVALGLVTVDAAGKMRNAKGGFVSLAQAAELVEQKTKTAAATAEQGVTRWQRLAAALRSVAATARAMPSAQLGMGGARAGRIASGIGSLAGSALDTARGFGSTLGIPGRDQLAGEYANFDLSFARLTNQAHLDDAGKAALRQQISEASRSGMQDPTQVLEALTTAQNRFSNLSGFAENANRFAEAATALGTPMQDIVGAVGEFQRQLGVTANEVPELIGMMTDASARGSVEFSDISAEFATTIGQFARVTGQQGMEGARSFIGLAQVLGAGGAGGAGSATLAQNLLSKFASADVQRNMRRAGLDTGIDARGRGQFVGIDAIVQQMRGNSRFVGPDGQVNAGALQGILGADMQANQAMGILLSEAGKGNTIGSLAQSSAAAGNATIDNTMRDIRASAGGGVLQAQTDARTNFLQNGEELVRNMTSMAASVSNLDTRFPRLSAAIDVTRGSFDTLRTTLSQVSMIQMSTAMGGAAGAANGAAGASLGFAGKLQAAGIAIAAFEGALHGTLAMLDGAMQSGILGQRLKREGGSASQDFADFSFGQLLTGGYDVFGSRANGGSAADIQARVRANAQRTAGGGQPGGPVDAANTQATSENTQAVREHARALDRNTRAQQNRPNTGATPDAGR